MTPVMYFEEFKSFLSDLSALPEPLENLYHP